VKPGLSGINPTVFDWPLRTIPRLFVAGRFPLADAGFATTYLGRHHALHLHDYAGRMRLGVAEMELASGDATISPAGRPSAYDLSASGRHWCIHFGRDAADHGARVAAPLHLRLGAGAGVVRERMAQIARLHAGREDPIAAASAGLALQDLLLWLAARARALPAADAAVEAAAVLIDERFHEPLTVPRIAREVGRSPNYLARRFRDRYGVTIARRVLLRRMEHARFLLELTDLPIWRVAERVGIPDAHHFNKTLRRLLGASPTALRRAAASLSPIDPDR